MIQYFKPCHHTIVNKSAMAIITFIEALTTDTEVPGWASLAMAVTLFAGIQLLSLGILGEYVGRIFQSGHRKTFVVRECVRPSDKVEV